mmetsp:Transcript_15538/g.29491  ORF Transcript_15538/g.29491 Transcript_15538/m.29491 type:complete len:460 (-) Transcript_15538:1640-3019(-)
MWFVVVAAAGVICLSYGVASILEKLPFFQVENRTDFDALRIAAAFPNIVALPILIFPTLCEFPVVYDSFYEGEDGSTDAEKFRSCVDQSNAMIFIYFFAFNLLYWILGYPTLVAAGQKRQNSDSSVSTAIEELKEVVGSHDVEGEHKQSSSSDALPDEDVNKDVEGNQPSFQQVQSTNDTGSGIKSFMHLFSNAVIQTIKSPGFIAMALGFITACITPLRDALFSPGGALRFIGSSIESLGSASSSLGTLLVAASLVHQAEDDAPSSDDADTDIEESQISSHVEGCATRESGIPTENKARKRGRDEECYSTSELNQQNSQDRRASMQRRQSSILQMSSKVIAAIRRRKPTIRMHAWFVVSRLIVTPAIVCAVIIAMDCGGALDNVPNLAKMVVIVNSGLPGAQLIILTLKSKGLSDSASVVAEVYIPSYLLSVITVAAWASLGLAISVPSEDGTPFCKR